MADAVGFEAGEEFLKAFVADALDAGAAAGGDNAQGGFIGREETGDEFAAALLKIAQNTHFGSETFLGVGPAKSFVHPPVVTHSHDGPLGIL